MLSNMKSKTQPSVLIIRPEYEVAGEDNPSWGTGDSVILPVSDVCEGLQDKDLRMARVHSTAREKRVFLITRCLFLSDVTLPLPPVPSIDLPWWTPFSSRSDALPVPQLEDTEPKAKKRMRGRLAILVEMLCALLSSLVVQVYPQRAGKGRDESSSPEGLGQTRGGDLRLLSDGSVQRKTKCRLIRGEFELHGILDKDCTSYSWPQKPAKREFTSGEFGNEISDYGEQSRKDQLWRIVGLFDRFQPGVVSGLLYPVSRGQSERDPRAGSGGEGRSQLTPQALSSADTQWPPDSMHDTPWVTFRQELYRLGTFLNLPNDFPVSPLRLAQTGFLRLANGSIVCFFCGLIRSEWSLDESPLQVHRQLRPDCPMVTGVSCDNIAVTDTLPTDQLTQDMQRWSLQSGASGRPPTTDRNGLHTGDISEDGSSQAPEVGAQARTTSAGAEGHSPRTANQDVHEPNPQQAQRQQQPPRLGLMGGAPSSASTEGRSPILDGTAQPGPPAPDPPVPDRTDTGRQVVTYEELGIVTGSAKRPDMATVHSRLATYRGWSDTHRPSPEDFAEAGFYYAGYSDCGRCFSCGSGLKNWEPTDDPWVAHARWFPTCAFVRQSQGQDFIDIVRQLNAQNDGQPISVAQVRAEMTRRRVGDLIEDAGMDTAVVSAVRVGYSTQQAQDAAQRMLREGQQLSVVSLMEILERDRAQAAAAAAPETEASIPDDTSTHAQMLAEVESLQTENSDLRQRAQCKICLDREASVIFLPCGHLATCGSCSPALHSCPMCRLNIKGRVRAFHRLT